MSKPEKNINSPEKSQLKSLIAKGKEQGFHTYAEVNDHLPNEIIEPEQIEDIVNQLEIYTLSDSKKIVSIGVNTSSVCQILTPLLSQISILLSFALL